MLSTLRRRLTDLAPVLGPALCHLLWPWRCPLCDSEQALASGRIVCPACHDRLLAGQIVGYCAGCGRDMTAASPKLHLPPSAAAPERCPACRRQPLALAAIAVAGRHKDLLRQAIVLWKFHRQFRLEPLLTGLLSDALAAQPWLKDIDALVPVPQPWARWLRRGLFWPAGHLAEGVSRQTGLPTWPVLKARWHRPQVGLSRQRRQENARDVFYTAASIHLQGKRLCLVDDVKTTGATLHAAAAALRKAGADRVYGLVVATALG